MTEFRWTALLAAALLAACATRPAPVAVDPEEGVDAPRGIVVPESAESADSPDIADTRTLEAVNDALTEDAPAREETELHPIAGGGDLKARTRSLPRGAGLSEVAAAPCGVAARRAVVEFAPPPVGADAMAVHAIDVGQADAFIVEFAC